VAVIDSGTVAAGDFGARLTQVVLPGQTTAVDTYGHGAFVTSVLAGSSADGRYVGIAPGTTIYGINTLNSSGTLYSSDVIAGLNWVASNAAAKNIRVVNISLAETVASSYLTSALDSAVEQVWRAGVVVVTSAGNLGGSSSLYAPANDPFVITVGATDSNDTASTSDDTMATFSSTGTTQDGFAKPDILAPGRHVIGLLPSSTTLGAAAPAANIVAPGYATMSGTSFSAPQVAAAAALLLQLHPTWTPDQVKWELRQTSRPVTGTTFGALDIAASIGFTGLPGSSNTGIAPAPVQAAATVTTVIGNTSGWNTSGWNTSGWNAFAWS
jgi:serine protease AprX